MVIPHEPIKKGDRRARGQEAAIRDQVAWELRGAKRSTLTGSIALSVHFTHARREPPDLPKLSKYLLDVLGSDRTGEHRGPTLYRDDEQIKMLHVSWSRAPVGGGGSICLVVRPLRDVVADLRLGEDVELATQDADAGNGPFALEDLDRIDDGTELAPESQEGSRQLDRRRYQDVLLQRTGALFRHLLGASPKAV